MLGLLDQNPFAYLLVDAKRRTMTVWKTTLPRLYKPHPRKLAGTVVGPLRDLDRFAFRLHRKLKKVFDLHGKMTKVLHLHSGFPRSNFLIFLLKRVYHLHDRRFVLVSPHFDDTPCRLTKWLGAIPRPRR